MRFLRKKEKEEDKTEEALEEEVKEETDLEIICGEDKEAYEALGGIMLMDPRKLERMLGVSMEEIIRQAKKRTQDEKDPLKVRALYKQALQFALYKGDVDAVEKFAKKYSELIGEKLKILEIPERAVQKSQEYYEKYLK